MKYYVVVDTWKREEEMASTVMGVYTTRGEAEKRFKTCVEAVKAESARAFDTTFDTTNETNDYYEAYNDGYFSEAHDYIFIQEVEM